MGHVSFREGTFLLGPGLFSGAFNFTVKLPGSMCLFRSSTPLSGGHVFTTNFHRGFSKPDLINGHIYLMAG